MGDVVSFRPRRPARSGWLAADLAPLPGPRPQAGTDSVDWVNAVVQTMAGCGMSPMQISIELARHLNEQIDLAMPTADAATACKTLLLRMP